MLAIGRPGRGLVVILVLLSSLAVHSVLAAKQDRDPKIASGDGVQYLDTAYNIRTSGTFTEAAGPAAVEPAVGREPLYPLMLAGLMWLDPGMSAYRPGCAGSSEPCDAGRFRILSLANLALIDLTALLAFALVRRVTGSDAGALVGAGYFLFNLNLLRSHWFDPMSDELALALVAAAMLAVARAWGREAPLRWLAVGVLLAALTLTKAVFLPFSLGLAAVTLGRWVLRGSVGGVRRRMPLIAMAVYLAAVGGWMARNWQVSGSFRLTDDRGGIALSTREVFDHMTAAQVAAAFVFWTPGGGEALARRFFPPDTVAPFELYAPGGFYDRGQNGYDRRVDAEIASTGVDRWQARSRIDRAIVAELLAHPFGYLASLPPLVYRGLWFDQFAVFSLPLLVWTVWRSRRSGDPLVPLLLGFGLFNELFYALFSLNIQRYQITAMPSLALAAALAALAAARRIRAIRPRGLRSPDVGPPHEALV